MFRLPIDSSTELRLLSEDTALEFHRLLVANLDRLRPWFEFAQSEQPYDVSLEFVRRTQRRYTNGEGFWAGIWHDGALIGTVGLASIDGPNSSAELSYWLSRDAVGKGIATRACAAMIEWTFAERRLNRVAVRCAADNAKSRAVVERLGFRQEGVMRQAERVGGHFRDVLIYGLLAEEWASATRLSSGQCDFGLIREPEGKASRTIKEHEQD